MTLTFIGYILLSLFAGTIAGVILIPGFNFLFVRSLPLGIRTVFGRIIWCMGSLALDNARLVRTPGGYQVRQVVEDEDGTESLYLGEDDYRELEEGGYTSRFGLIPFGVTYLPEGERFGEIQADDIQEISKARADGGIVPLNSQRAGYQEFVPQVDDDAELIKINKAEERIRNAAGANQANIAEDITLKEEGGAGTTSNTMMAVTGLASLLFGAVMAWIVMGL